MTICNREATANRLQGRRLWLILAVLLPACSKDPNKQKLAYLNSGDQYFKAAKYQEAVIEFRNAIQIDPRLANAHQKLAMAYLKLGNSEAAYRELRETVSLDPKNRDAQLETANLLLARRQYSAAQAATESALKLDPNSPRGHSILGQIYILTRDREKAIQELSKAVDADPQSVEARGALGAAYLAAGRTSEAEAAYRKGVEIGPKSLQSHVALGQFWFSQGRVADAEAEMRIAAGLDPHAVPPRLLLVGIYRSSNRLKEAEELCSQLRIIAPENPLAYRALASFYNSTGQKEKAVAELRSLAAAKPADEGTKASLIDTLLDLNHNEEARTLNREVLRRNPTDPQALLANGRMLMADSNYRDAATALQSATKSDPNCARCFYLLGGAQWHLGLVDQARASLSRAHELAPQMPDPTAALAGLDLQSHDYDRALKLAGDALKADPNLASAYVTEARALIAKGDLSNAETRLLEALKRDDGSLSAIAMLLSLHMREGKTQAALPLISRMIEQRPQSAELRVLLAVAYFNLKDLDKAESNVRQALALDPKARDAYTLLGNIDLSRGNIDAAKTAFRSAIQVEPNSLVNYLALENQYERESNWDEAKKLCERAHQINPGSPVVAFRLARLYEDHGGDINVALSLAQMAKQNMPGFPGTADVLGWADYKLGASEAAIAQLKESVDKEPNNPIYQYHLGMAYLASGRSELARDSLRRALASDPSFPEAATARAALDKASKPPAGR